jgi:hypothetical protein
VVFWYNGSANTKVTPGVGVGLSCRNNTVDSIPEVAMGMINLYICGCA